ncbi:MAG: transposase [Planctomycetaceae bacterium]|nr:transposase [Planctomycetaceae bacterium]
MLSLRFVFLPKHSSWLNQIEVLFGIVMRKVMRRGNFTSVADLEDKLRQFLKYFNDTMAHPFHWTHTGKPTFPQSRHLFQPPHRRKLWHPKITLAKLAL